MAKIQVVDYKDLSSKSKRIRSEAEILRDKLKESYTKVGSMHSSWYGRRYTDLVKAFNKMLNDVNEMIKLVTADIPDNLDKVAYNYSQADSDKSVLKPKSTNPTKIAKLPEPIDVGMRFITSSVESTKSQVENCFRQSKDQMDKIGNVFASVTWDSEAGTAFKSKFNTLKGKLISSFENLEADFKKLMDQTIKDIEAAEKANTVS